MTSQQHWARQSWVLLALCACGLIVAVIASAAYFRANSAFAEEKVAIARAQSVAQCVDTILADRQPITADEDAAVLNFIDALNAVLVLPTGTAQTAAYAQFEIVLAQTAKTLNDGQAFTAAHPLGRC